MPGLVGIRDAAGKTRNALAPELASVFAAESRRMALDVLAALPPGEVLGDRHRRAVRGRPGGVAAAAPARGPAPTRSPGRWTRPRRWA